MKIHGKEWKREDGIEIAEEIRTKQELKRLRSLLQATCLRGGSLCFWLRLLLSGGLCF